MQGHPAVIDALNALLVEWGLTRAADHIAYEMEDETAHAAALINRVLMLGGTPRMTSSALNVGHDLPSIFANDLAVELAVETHLRDVVALCERESDYVTREVLLPHAVAGKGDAGHHDIAARAVSQASAAQTPAATSATRPRTPSSRPLTPSPASATASSDTPTGTATTSPASPGPATRRGQAQGGGCRDLRHTHEA